MLAFFAVVMVIPVLRRKYGDQPPGGSIPHTTHPFPTACLLITLQLLRSVLAVAGLGWALAATPAKRTLYKSVLTNGRVVYGDAPDPQARRSEKISVEIHPPHPAQTEAGLRALAMTPIAFVFEGQRPATTVTGKAGEVRFVRLDGMVWAWKSTFTWATESEDAIRERALKARLVADLAVR